MAKLWTTGKGMDTVLEDFCFGGDVVLDSNLVRYDILGSLAHARMLKKIGILDAAELAALVKGLSGLCSSHERGEWKIETADEDVHTAVENRLGEAGKKLHTGRSRNDQVLTDMRLYARDRIMDAALGVVELAGVLLSGARRHEYIPMPGYTHLQRAMPSSYGMWLGSFVEGLVDTLRELECAHDLMDQCPLGSGAGYGVSLPLDRQLTADLLGFSRVQSNSLYCQNSRGHFEAVLISAFTSVMSLCGRLSADICLFCSEEFKFVTLPDQFFTGSSIMPQKKNPDIFELMRTKVLTLSSLESRVRGITHGITSGYSKDLQEVKGPVMEACELTLQSLKVMQLVLRDLAPNTDRLRKAMSPELFAAHKAYEKVQKGMAFRDAYHAIKKELKQLDKVDPERTIRDMKHIGATGNLGLAGLQDSLESEGMKWLRRRNKLHKAWDSLLKPVK